MGELIRIPMFPLSIFPLPGELVPLHIFEPRYRQLFKDAEEEKLSFGIYFNHTTNTQKLGSLVQLESVIKRYKTGESDVMVKCIGLFRMDKLYRTFGDKLYPGGDVEYLSSADDKVSNIKLIDSFREYQDILNQAEVQKQYSVYAVANELQLETSDKVKLVCFDHDKKENFLLSRIHYQLMLLKQAEKSKDVFHLN